MPVWASFNNLHTSVWVGRLAWLACETPDSRCFWTLAVYTVHCLEGSTCFCPSLVVFQCFILVFFFDRPVDRNSRFWPQIRQDYPLNLSILISGGKETNKDSSSNGEWSRNSSDLKSVLLATLNCSLEIRFQGDCAVLKLLGTAHRRGWQSRTWYCASFTMRFLWVGLVGNPAQNWW